MTILITGSSGLIGGEAVAFFAGKGFKVIGVDNNMREYFFGKEGSTEWNAERLSRKYMNYVNYSYDIRSEELMDYLFGMYGKSIKLIIHTAAQPSHDWAIKEPVTDFSINAVGTLVLLEMMRKYCPKAVFIYTSTNKVYGDTPNQLPLFENPTRWEIDAGHDVRLWEYKDYGIDESMSIDDTTHSLFGVSKLAADLLVQEYGKYFGMKTACFRGGCLTGPNHSGAELHGFLSYLVKCAVSGKEYKVFGYKGKQVRDNIHSYDLVNAFYHFYQNPRCGEVYNIGGGPDRSCSILEAISKCEKLTGKKMKRSYKKKNRIGDHIWYVSDVRKFQKHYPDWKYKYSLDDIFRGIYEHEEESK